MYSRTLTLKQLLEANACASKRAEFKRRFGDRVEITPALCESVASVFDFMWAATHLLSEPARAEWERIRKAAWAERERIPAPARAEYVRIRASAWAEFEHIRASAFAYAYINDYTREF